MPRKGQGEEFMLLSQMCRPDDVFDSRGVGIWSVCKNPSRRAGRDFVVQPFAMCLVSACRGGQPNQSRSSMSANEPPYPVLDLGGLCPPPLRSTTSVCSRRRTDRSCSELDQQQRAAEEQQAEDRRGCSPKARLSSFLADSAGRILFRDVRSILNRRFP